MKTIKYIIIITLLTTLQSCYISKKLDRSVPISLDENYKFVVENIGNSNFTEGFSDEELKSEFISGMLIEFESNQIILVEDNFEFLVSISRLAINESTKKEIISDNDSPNNGTEYELSTISINSKGLIDSFEGKHIGEQSASKSKSEKTTSNRSIIEYAVGGNKEANLYREKEFDGSETKDLVYKCGRRTAARIIIMIAKELK